LKSKYKIGYDHQSVQSEAGKLLLLLLLLFVVLLFDWSAAASLEYGKTQCRCLV